MVCGKEAVPGPHACVPSVSPTDHLPQTGISVLKGHISTSEGSPCTGCSSEMWALWVLVASPGPPGPVASFLTALTVFLTRDWDMPMILRVPGGETRMGLCAPLSPRCFSLLLKWWLLYGWSMSPKLQVSFLSAKVWGVRVGWEVFGSWVKNTMNWWLLLSVSFLLCSVFCENDLLQKRLPPAPSSMSPLTHTCWPLFFPPGYNMRGWSQDALIIFQV